MEAQEEERGDEDEVFDRVDVEKTSVRTLSSPRDPFKRSLGAQCHAFALQELAPSVRESRGRGDPDKKMEQRKDGKPVTVMDYNTFTVDGAEKKEDAEDTEAQTKATVMRHQGT